VVALALYFKSLCGRHLINLPQDPKIELHSLENVIPHQSLSFLLHPMANL